MYISSAVVPICLPQHACLHVLPAEGVLYTYMCTRCMALGCARLVLVLWQDQPLAKLVCSAALACLPFTEWHVLLLEWHLQDAACQFLFDVVLSVAV
jgi:hypothetical protein